MLGVSTRKIGEQLKMPVDRMSFNEIDSIRNSLGFIVRLKIDYRPENNTIIVRKGSLIYGFYDITKEPETFGYLLQNDYIFDISQNDSISYIIINKDGVIQLIPGDFSQLRGIGAEIEGIPWYTIPYAGDNYALIGKLFLKNAFITGWIVCDDVYWCEYEEVL